MSVSDDALSTLDSVKEWASITGSNQATDDLLETLIDNISVAFTNYCGLDSFKENNYIEYYDGSGGMYLFVKNVPINSVEDIWNDGDWNYNDGDKIDSDEYRVVEKNYIVSKTGFSSGIQNIKVKYNAGYTSIPKDVNQACNEEVYRRYKKRKEIDVQIKTLEEGSLHYPSIKFLDSTFQVLAKYMRMRAL